MAISQVRVKINGTWTNMTYSGGKWTGNITAPSATSYNLSGGYYPVTIEVTNDAGTVVTKEATDGDWGNALKFVVKETIKPAISLTAPSNGAYVTNNKYPVTFTVTDESGGSGIKLSGVTLKIDSTSYVYNSTGMVYTTVTNGYQFIFTPQNALSDGSHTITINASDNDGNAATAVSSSFMIDTVPPELNVSSPAVGLITNNSALTISGTTNDAVSSPVTVKITLNGTDQGNITVNGDGSFAKAVTLAEGTNTVLVKATDSAGKESSVTRSVKLDTSIPEISTITLAPNPANTSASVMITVEVT